MGSRLTRSVLAAGLALLVTAGTAACSGGDDNTDSTSVFAVKPGQCFLAPASVKAELDSLSRVSCSAPHTQEAYAVVAYAPAASAGISATGGPSLSRAAYPGDDVLTTFAQGACAQRYTGYVGISYLDSKLYFTYLLPSARSWEQAGDRNVLCFVTTTGAKLTRSVKNSKM